MPGFLGNERLQLVLFGGKGGSGKTTSAAATALHLAQLKPERSILVVSTDPAHSLGDSFNCQIGNKITSISGVNNLWALEMNAPGLLEDFNRKHGSVIKKLADRGTYFDGQDIEDFFSLSLPGLDEVMAIIEIANILRSGQYNLIILDTAPTGHTIRLLALPAQMEKWIHVMDMMQDKHRYLFRHFTGKYVKDDCDKFLEMMVEDVGRVKSLLSNSQLTEFVPVTIPESLSIDETERLLLTLKEHKIPVRNIIVNRVAGGEECPFCLSRRRDQQKHVREIEEKFAAYNLIKMPLFPHEIRGIEALREFAEILLEKASYSHKPSFLEPPLEISSTPTVWMSDLLKKDLQFILFGGKGGVGKTSIAAATALRMARCNPDKKVLVFSTDPAHSLSDSFDCPIGDKITLIKDVNNLYGLEIDAGRLLEDLKKEYKADIEEVFDKFLGGGIDIKFDREVMTELISLSPPGLDEIMALKKIMEFVEDRKFDFYILDLAATGHLLRFLELPGLVRDWLKTLFRLLLKYKGVVRLTSLAERMVDLSKSVREIQETLMDAKKSEFVIITIPEAMGLAEMERLQVALKELKISCHYVVINMVIPPSECSFCALKSKEQQKYVQEASKKFSRYLINQVPLFPHEIKGLDDLTNLSEIMYGRATNQFA